ncbi:MAG: integrase [Oligoflexia bacterium]|nr:integrase [Oligoflexia bacterium]
MDEFCKVCGYNRNYAIRKLNQSLELKKKKPGRKPIYDEEFIKVLVSVWQAMQHTCSKKMVEALPLWLVHHDFTREVGEKLKKISASQIDRLLVNYRNPKIKGKSLTRGNKSFIKRIIPLKPLDVQYTKPGSIQGDTVAHCGDSIAGFYAYSLTMTDIYSTWTENRATWTKSAFLVGEAIKDIEKAMPFPMTDYSADNGSEVLNESIFDYFQKRANKVNVTRGRPYRKNDQAYVEQKNHTHVRGLLGYERVDERSLVNKMNEIYKLWNQLQNFFIPSMKCMEKKRDGAKIIKKYDKPKTPYQRILDSADVKEEAKEKLRATYALLNPFELSKEIDKRRKSFFSILNRLKQGRVA